MSIPSNPRLSIVVPCYNEREVVTLCLDRVLATPHTKEVIVVDDGSKDGTRDVLTEYARTHDIRLFLQPKNMGKGAALREGFRHVTGDIVLIQDADLEYDPKDYDALIRPLADGRADVVFGSRFLGYPRRAHLFWHRMGNVAMTLLSNMVTNLDLTDMETCYKAFRADYLPKLELESDGFNIEPELTAKLAAMHARIYEVPISYAGRDYAEGKKITWRDGVKGVYAITRFGLQGKRLAKRLRERGELPE